MGHALGNPRRPRGFPSETRTGESRRRRPSHIAATTFAAPRSRNAHTISTTPNTSANPPITHSSARAPAAGDAMSTMPNRIPTIPLTSIHPHDATPAGAP